jgi:GT2 family glycosyltransferase
VPRLAIVIPAIGTISALENSLVSVLEHRPDDCEVIVVLNQRYADPYALAGEVTFVQAPARTGMVACINRGMLETQADFIHVLAAGCEVAENWTDPAIARFDDSRVAAVVPLVLNAGTAEPLCRGIDLLPGGIRRLHAGDAPATHLRQQETVWGPALFAAFYRMSAVNAVGGLSTAVGDEFADADLACSLGRAGYAIAWEPASCVVADAAVAMPRGGRLRRSWQSQRLFGRTLAVFGWARSLPALTAVVGREFVAALPNPLAFGQIAARLLACCDWGHYHRHQLRFQKPAISLPIPSPREIDFRRLDRSHASARRAEAVGPTVKTG